MPATTLRLGSLALAGLLFCTACLIYDGERQPPLPVAEGTAHFEGAPQIELILHHRHTLDGDSGGGRIEEGTFKSMKESFERVRPDMPFLANAKEGNPRAEYLLELKTEIAEHGEEDAMISGFSLMLIPGFLSSDVIVDCTLKDMEGQPIAASRASREVKFVVHLGLLPLLPALPWMAPGKGLYDDTFRDALLLLEAELEKTLDKK